MVRDVVVRNDHMCNKFRYKPSDDVSCIRIAFISDTMTVSPYSDVLWEKDCAYRAWSCFSNPRPLLQYQLTYKDISLQPVSAFMAKYLSSTLKTSKCAVTKLYIDIFFS